MNKKKNKGHKPKRPMTTKAYKAQKLTLSFKPHHTGLWFQRSFNKAHVGVLNKEERKLFTWGSWKAKERKKKKESYSRGGAGKVRKERKRKRSTAGKRRKEKKKKKREEGMLKHNPDYWIRQKFQNLQTLRSS